MRLAALLLALTGCGGPPLHVEPPPATVRGPQTEAWLTQIRASALPGDWLVIRGYKAADDLVVAATNIPLSHAAVIDVRADEVIESIAEGVRVTPLRDFVDHAHRVLLVRPKWSQGVRPLKALERARAAVGKGYDFSGLVGLSAKDRYYCSELAMYAWQPFMGPNEHVPRVIEPGQMYLWGRVLYDSGSRN